MIRAILFFLLVTVLVCSAQYQSNPYDLTFVLNDDGITEQYEVAWWEGADTTVAAPVTVTGFYNHATLMAYINGTQTPPPNILVVNAAQRRIQLVDIYPSLENGEALKGYVRAHTVSNGLTSEWGESPAYIKANNPVTASIPAGVGILH